MQCINTENWTYSRYQKGEFVAQITFGACPESLDEGRLEYYVTVLQNDVHETFQEKFSSLGDACLFLNTNYGDWTFEDQLAPKSGCSTCAAH